MQSLSDFSAALVFLVKGVPLAFLALFPVINPLGTAVILFGMTSHLSAADRRSVARRVGLNTFLLLGIVLLFGSYIMGFFGLTVPIVQAAGGLVLASMGWNLLNAEAGSGDKAPGLADSNFGELLFYPFTFPITVGPGGIAVALTLSAHTQQHESLLETSMRQVGALLGIVGVCAAVYFSLAYSELLARRLGPSGTKVMLRIMAFIVVCLGASIFWNGASTLLRQAIHP